MITDKQTSVTPESEVANLVWKIRKRLTDCAYSFEKDKSGI